MITIARSKRFDSEYKKFVKKNTSRAEKIIKAINLFVNDPNHPSLNVEKLKGSNIWTMRLSQSDSIFFLWIKKSTIMLIDVGLHDKYKIY